MGAFGNRLNLIAKYVSELVRFGLPERTGEVGDELLVVVDGVGRFQAAPLMVRRALREKGIKLATFYFSWQFGLPGEIWTDLMWYSRNRRMARKLTRKLIALRRSHPETAIHLLAYSGGVGVAVFALENLRGAALIDTLILACPALSPDYDLSSALRPVRRCYALVSEKDRVILGLGTSLFGTTDRKHTPAAGCVGFQRPPGWNERDQSPYEKLRQVRWSPDLLGVRHHGGHSGYATEAFLGRYLMGFLRGEPELPTEGLPAPDETKVRKEAALHPSDRWKSNG